MAFCASPNVCLSLSLMASLTAHLIVVGDSADMERDNLIPVDSTSVEVTRELEKAEPSRLNGINLAPLEGVRGLCSLVIPLGHLLTFWAPAYARGDTTSPFPLFGVEYLSATALFFVLSGFTLVTVYDTDASSAAGPFSSPTSVRTFMLRRVARLAPIYYLSLLIAIPVLMVYHPEDWPVSVPLELAGVQAWTLTGFTWNAPLWQVSALLPMYIAFPWLLRSVRGHSSATLVTIGAICAALMMLLVAVWLLFIGVGSVTFLLHSFPLFRFPQFVIGVIAGLLSKRHRMSPGTATALVELGSAALVANQVACAVVAHLFGLEGWFYYQYAAEFVAPAAYGLWIAALCQPLPSGSAEALDGSTRLNAGCIPGLRASMSTRALLSSAPLRWLGSVSYALYCLHWPVLHWAGWAVAGSISAASVPLIYGSYYWNFPGWAVPLLLAVCLVVAAIAHRLVEAPARKSIRKRSDAPASAAGAMGAAASTAAAAAAAPMAGA